MSDLLKTRIFGFHHMEAQISLYGNVTVTNLNLSINTNEPFLKSLLFIFTGENDIILIYTRHPPLSWSQTTLGLFKGSQQFLKGLTVLILLPIAKRRFGIRDTVAIIIGLVSYAGEQVVLGVASSTGVLFIGSLIKNEPLYEKNINFDF